MNNLFNQLKQLNFPKGKFAIFGSAPMAVRGIRKSNDLDIIVTQDLWNDLVKLYPNSLIESPYTALEIWGIEVFKTWLELTNKIDEMIKNADIINDLPFVKLEYVLEWKKSMWREKDLKDIELVNQYISSQR